MAKNPNYKPSANSSRKGSYSHEASPLHSSKLKKESHNVFQPSDLDSNLKSSLKSGVKKNEPKLLTANVFINNLSVHMNGSQLHQRKISAPLSATIANRKNSKQYAGLSQKEEAALAEYRQSKLSQRGIQTTGSDTIPKKVLSGPTQYEFQKNQVALVPKQNNEGHNELSKSSFIAKFKGSDPINKFTLRSPPKVFSQPDSSTKFKKPNSRGQQKSFDVNSGGGPVNKYTPYLGSYGKPPTTANNSPKNKDNTEERVTKTENTGRISQNNKPKSGRAELDKSTPAPRVVTKSPMIVSKHRKTPSFDITKRSENMQQKTMTPPVLDRMRKSADHGEYWQGNAKEQEQSVESPKPSFRFAIRTRAGVAPNGTRKINQDSFIFHTNFGKKSDRHLIGVCDGHGTNGHFVSGFVKDIIPAFLLADPNFESKTDLAFVNAFELCQQKLLVTEFDCKFSGTTAVVLLLNGNKIMTANSGDSRAIMGSYNKGWSVTPLTEDHKPDTPQEAIRIQKCGGRIEPFRDMDGNFVGPYRVWLMHQDIPGLAMSRSLGDIVASTVGVSCIPEIKEFTITPHDKFMIIASDGIWEFIESVDVVKIIAPFYEQGNIEGACDFLLGVALRRWQEEEEVVVDDITLIILFF